MKNLKIVFFGIAVLILLMLSIFSINCLINIESLKFGNDAETNAIVIYSITAPVFSFFTIIGIFITYLQQQANHQKILDRDRYNKELDVLIY